MKRVLVAVGVGVALAIPACGGGEDASVDEAAEPTTSKATTTEPEAEPLDEAPLAEDVNAQFQAAAGVFGEMKNGGNVDQRAELMAVVEALDEIADAVRTGEYGGDPGDRSGYASDISDVGAALEGFVEADEAFSTVLADSSAVSPDEFTRVLTARADALAAYVEAGETLTASFEP